MKLTIQRADLSRVITNVGRVVEARNTIPILSNVLLDAKNNTLTVSGTDLDILATASAPAKIDKPGSLTVSAKLLGDIVKKAGSDDISIEKKGDSLIVSSGRSKFTLATLPATDFPDIAGTGEFTTEFDIDLAAFFAPVAFAISSEEVRYYLNGVYFASTEFETVAVATDGHRLSRHKISSISEFAGVIVPRKIVSLLPKGTVTVAVSDTKIRIASGDFVMISKLIDGTFPDYQRVIPTANDKIVTVDREAIMKAADRVASISSERGRAVKLSIAPGSVALTAKSDVGYAEDEVAAEYSGEPLSIGFNSQYLRDLLSVLPGGPVNIALADAGSPGVVTSPAFEGLTLVAMPMRI
ncbi:DNA polymerase III subunit beta [Rhizobium rhizogenes]|uniref:DNA polymerase III subunit beta n=1 Tax=Rhizobium rhizogenes TaxID=359 RepID=UPI0015749A4D|nr:DNA polymerase III subunit beta [Rhizobium rhizogenes]NTF69407.1 DNA polymerase III subunit beta [Rhizobium rhizogenes]